jgi:hypothetical protein
MLREVGGETFSAYEDRRCLPAAGRTFADSSDGGNRIAQQDD